MQNCDLVIANARILSMYFRLRLFEGWLGIRDGRFLYVESRRSAARY
jgi:predicted amidohydrolase YtcJ